MAKKKFKPQLAAFLACAAIGVGGGGYFAYTYVRNSYRPAQFKKLGRELMLKGDYEGAYSDFARAAGGNRMARDSEFLGWMYETSLRRWSFVENGWKESRNLAEGMLAINPGDTVAIQRKLKLDLDLFGFASPELYTSDLAKRASDMADKVLAVDANNSIALQSKAMAVYSPLFKQDTTRSSVDVDNVVVGLRNLLEAHPDNPDISVFYAFAVSAERDALVREHAIDTAATDPRVKNMADDFEARTQSLIKFGSDESKPAEDRAMALFSASRIDQIGVSNGFAPSNEDMMKLYERRLKSLGAAATLVPPTSEHYIAIRVEQAAALLQQEKVEEAEASLKQTITGAPLSWQPRMMLADTFSDHGGAAEALELMKADLKPSYELIAAPGYQFFYDAKAIPLRRALYRLQNLPNVKPEQRDAEIAAATSDYDSVIADQKVSENNPNALQVKAAFQELKLDRTGAVQTLTRALESSRDQRLNLHIQQQLVQLNLAMNQPGAASAMLDAIRSNPTLTPIAKLNSFLQLIDLSIRNGATEQARVLLEKAKSMYGASNPALMVLDVKLISDPAQKKAALAKVPEDTPQLKFYKMKMAAEIADDPTVRRLAEDLLKADPGAVDTALLYGDYLRRNGKREEAVAVFQAAMKVHPENQTLDILIKDTQAVSTEQRQTIIPDLIKDPYRRTLVEADQFRVSNKFDDYYKKLLEAEPLDAAKDGVATERLALYYMAIGDSAKSTAAIDRLATMSRDPAQIRVLRIRLALATKNFADAGTQADSLTAELPSFVPGWVMKGMVAQQTNQPTQAIDAFETALTNQPDNIEALHGLVESSARAGRRDTLKRYIDQGLRVTKNNDDFFVDWSLRYETSFGDPTTAVDARLKRRDASPDEADRWLMLAQTYLASAQSKESAGDHAASVNYRAKALEVFKQASQKFPPSTGFALEAATIVGQDGDADGAIKMVDALASTPDLSIEVQAMCARFYAEHGKPDRAIALLKQVFDSGKATDAMRLQLVTLESAQGDSDSALKILDTMADSAEVRQAKISIYLSMKRFDDAQKLANEGLAKARSVDNLLIAAMVLASQQKTPEARKLADEAVALDGENASARFGRARLMLTERPLRNNDIIADLEVVRKNQPTNNDARLLLADRLRVLGRTNEATQELESLQRDNPGDRNIASQLVQAYANETPPRYARIDSLMSEIKKQGGDKDPQLLLLESAVAMQRGDKDHAVAAARAAAKVAPQEPVDRALLGTLLRAEANADAITEADRLQKDNAALYWTYLTRGVALHRLKRDDDSKKEFNRALGLAQALKDSTGATNDVAINYSNEFGAEAAADWLGTQMPSEPSTQELQMRVLTAGGKTDKAIAVGEAIMPHLSEMPKQAQIQILGAMGNAYLTSSPPKADNAQTMFGRLNELEPNNMMTLNNLAYAMTLSGTGPSMQDAVKIARQAYDLAEANAVPAAAITDTYGWTLFQAGKADDGLAILRQAQEEGSLPETDYHIGEVLIAQGQREPAIQSLKAAQAKINTAKQNGQGVDPTLPAHVGDAMKRAEAMTATP